MKAHQLYLRARGGGGMTNTSQLTKQYYFTAKIMLKYCSGRIPVDPLTSDWRRIAVAIVEVEYLWAVYYEDPPSFIWRGGEGRGGGGGGGGSGRGKKNWGTLFPANPPLLGQHYYFKHFSQLTKQYYFTAKIMLTYCSGENPWAVYCEGPPSFIWGEWEGRGKTLRNTFPS